VRLFSNKIRHLKFLVNYWPLGLLILFSGIIAGLMESFTISLFLPLLQGINEGGGGLVPPPFNYLTKLFHGMNMLHRLQLIAIILVSSIVIKNIMLYVKNICSYKSQIIISRQLRLLGFKQMMRVGMGYYNNQKSGDMHTIVGIYAHNISISLNRFIQLVHLPFTVFFILMMLFLLSWQVTLIALFLTLILLFVLRGLLKKLDKISRQLSPAIKNFNSTLLDFISGMKVVRLFNCEQKAEDGFEKVVDQYNDVFFKIGKLQVLVGPITEILGGIIVGIIIIVGSFILTNYTNYGLEVLLVFLLAFTRMMNPINVINKTRASFLGDLPYYRDFFNFLEDNDKALLVNGKKVFDGLNKGLELRNVNFAYNPQERIILNNASFYIPKGKKLGVVGPSGAGKSTLTELFLRFYDPQSGAILVDDCDLRDLEISSWRKKIGVVSQDVFLFNDTVRANIAYAKPEATQEEIDVASRKAFAYDFIQELPQGYDTLLGERGVLLSGGQRQRIAIARAILVNPEIFIFDEATSSLDTTAEKIVQQALDEIGKGKTVITIAHRLSTIFDSDLIVVIDAGQIVEQGTHVELMQKQDLYYSLVKLQTIEGQVQEKEDKLIKTHD